MRLTSFTDYGLRVLMRLAGDPSRAFSTAELAREFQVSRAHLAKVVSKLANGGWVSTRRGGGGGLQLAQPAASIRLGEVVAQLETNQALVECFQASGNTCTLTPTCRLKVRLKAANAAFISELNRATLADCLYYPDGARTRG
ncbi:Rrf2 family transcriptional regulator [Roseibacterium beibuensis]|uniref:Rrf2 family transcriptional regulator n=1 Tax=[Roseibacterium] beibuensis TaxID=1193142 RepID=A0ABP9LH31_9RHOB|nr:Rrf2 family transcriptional regulator [Roseibacterium beibuensis]MCS6623330.1 Rrf2 family transcriptional regulator [Roseibacterium beibuensis]